MTNRSKQKGTDFESLIRDYLKVEWSDIVERMTLSGNDDKGDISNFRVGSGQHKIAIECKNVRSLSLAGWVKEAQDEAEHYGAVAGIVVHKRERKGQAADQYVTLTLSDFLTILHASAS